MLDPSPSFTPYMKLVCFFNILYQIILSDNVSIIIAIFQAKEFGLKMKSIFPSKDGEFVAKFESWRIPRNKGDGNEQWSSLGSNSKT